MVNVTNGNNKVVLITGAARRVGAEIARYFHQHNYSIILHYRNSAKEANSLYTELNNSRTNSVKLIKCDLAQLVDPKYVTEFHQEVLDCYGTLDCLVNNASSFFPTPMGGINLDSWRDLMISNAGGPFFLAQNLAEALKKTKGSIINISDIHAERPLKNYPVYSIAKAANNMVTKTLARELAPHIRVNAVAPGPILWPEAENSLDEKLKDKIISKTLLQKVGTPQDIAKTVYFLADSEYITGQILAVDGGRSIRD